MRQCPGSCVEFGIHQIYSQFMHSMRHKSKDEPELFFSFFFFFWGGGGTYYKPVSCLITIVNTMPYQITHIQWNPTSWHISYPIGPNHHLFSYLNSDHSNRVPLYLHNPLERTNADCTIPS